MFLEACKIELKIEDLSPIEIACIMRVLAKPQLDDAIILNELVAIMENFGVPHPDHTVCTLADDEDYCCEGESKPRTYHLD